MEDREALNELIRKLEDIDCDNFEDGLCNVECEKGRRDCCFLCPLREECDCVCGIALDSLKGDQ